MTTHTGTFVGIVALVAMSSLSAQTPAPAPVHQAAGSPIIVNGCVERIGSGADATFKLTRVERVGTGGVDSGARPGVDTGLAQSVPGSTPAAPGSAHRSTFDPPKTYVLNPAPSVQLNPHVNHKVELTGTVEQPKTASAGPRETGNQTAAATTPSGATQLPKEAEADAPTLNVTALKMIAATCN